MSYYHGLPLAPFPRNSRNLRHRSHHNPPLLRSRMVVLDHHRGCFAAASPHEHFATLCLFCFQGSRTKTNKKLTLQFAFQKQMSADNTLHPAFRVNSSRNCRVTIMWGMSLFRRPYLMPRIVIIIWNESHTQLWSSLFHTDIIWLLSWINWSYIYSTIVTGVHSSSLW